MPGSSPLSTTLPMEAVMVSIYIDPVVSSWTTLLELMLEIPVVVTILIDITSMDISRLVRAGSSISKQATTSVLPWGGLDGHSTISAFVGGDIGGEGVFGKWTGSLMGITRENGWALPLGLSIPIGWKVSLVVGIASTLSAGGPNTWLNIVAEDGRQPPADPSILRPSNISSLVIVTNSLTAWLSSLTLSEGMAVWTLWQIVFLYPMLQAPTIHYG